MYYLKIIFLGMSLIIILINLKNEKASDKDFIKFLISSFFITLIIFLAVVIKLHHLLSSIFNTSNTVTYLFLAVIIVFFILRFFKMILRSNAFLFILSLVSFSLAIFYDLLTDIKILYFQWSDFIEEIFRIIGSLFWLLYFIFYKIEIESE